MSRSHVLVALVAGLAVNAVLALTSACAPASLQDAASTRSTAIVDGQLATEDQVGATVSLLMFGESSCTGTLIAPRVVATAAHCLSGVNESELQIVVRSTVPAENGIRLPVESLTPHPEYASFGIPCDDPAGLCDERDIGVVVLAQDAPVSPAPPLALDDVDNRLHDGVDVVIAGYGLTEFSEDGDYGRLYIARTPFIRRSEAEILAGRPGSPDSCNGDSGGPAYVEIDGVLHLAGITSRASLESFEPCGEGGIYTLFPAFASFVEEASGGLFDGDGGSVDLPPPPPPPEGAGSCARACNAAPPDQSCFCDSFCMAAGDCCEDFNAECPEVPEWTCSLEQVEDEACDCDCGAPDPACGASECAPAEPPPPAPIDDGEDNVDIGPANEPPAPAGCASTGSSAMWWSALLLVVVRRRSGERPPRRAPRLQHE